MSMEQRIDEVIAKAEILLKLKEAELASIEAEEAQALTRQDRSAEIIALLTNGISAEADGESCDMIALEREIAGLEHDLKKLLGEES
jgi:hypothetical protein